MDDAEKRNALARMLAERRRALGGWRALDPRLLGLAGSNGRPLLPPRPQAGHSTASMVLLAAVGGVALMLCVATAAAVVVGGAWLQGTLHDPATTVEGFYGALQQRDYTRAYNYFASSARAHLSESAFADQYSSFDQLDGPVATFTITHTQLAANGAVATIAVAITRKSEPSRAQVQTLQLVQEQGDWRIESITLNGSAPLSLSG